MEIRSSKTKLFLIELIIIILFFSIASVVCMNIFAAAKITNTQSTDLTHALFEVQETAEVVRAGEVDKLPEAVGAQAVDDHYLVYYDAQWNKTSAGNETYVMEVAPSRDGGMLTCDIQVTKSGDVIYEVSVMHYEGKEA